MQTRVELSETAPLVAMIFPEHAPLYAYSVLLNKGIRAQDRELIGAAKGASTGRKYESVATEVVS